MSGIFAVIGPERDFALAESTSRRMLGATRRRGARATLIRQRGVVLGLARHDWEAAADGDALAAEDGELAVVADAALYYRAELRRRLASAGVRVTGDSVARLILAAYRAWGDECPARLEGDFAFALYDARRHTLLCARDFAGSRPLFHARLGGGVFGVASTIDTLLQHPGCDAALDLAALGIDAAGLAFSVGEATCRRGVRRLEGATRLTSAGGAAPTSRRFWMPSAVKSGVSFARAADELRELIGDATVERLDVPDRPSTIWLSGGWDSTAIYGAGQSRLAARARTGRLEAVAGSHPEGDPGREDEKIEATVARWGSSAHWLPVRDTRMLEVLEDRIAAGDEPAEHLFAGFSTALARTTRQVGGRIALDGYGGDFLFNGAGTFLADLLASGRLLRVARESRSMIARGFGWRDIFRFGVQPLLGPRVLDLMGRLRGKPLPVPQEQRIPFWIQPEFARAHDLAGRARIAGSHPQTRAHHADRAIQWFLTQPFFTRARALLAAIALDEGVELRAPLYDRRIVDFALSRPGAERSAGGQGKRLLRHAMRALLPAEVLAPRPFKTGNLNAYFAAAFQAREAAVRDELARPLLLEELGIVDGARYRKAIDLFFRLKCDVPYRVELSQTLLAESWLRTREQRAGGVETERSASAVREMISA